MRQFNLIETKDMRPCTVVFRLLQLRKFPSLSPRLSVDLFAFKMSLSPKITVSKVDLTKESHPRLSSPKITHTMTFFVSFNHVLVLPFNLDFNPTLRCRLPRCLPPKLQSKIYSFFNKLTSGWRRCFLLLLDSEGSGDGGKERDRHTKKEKTGRWRG